MGYGEAFFLGAVQGLTEFLPVSSSGHLTVLPAVLQLSQPSLVFDVSVHLATLIAVTIYFWSDLVHIVGSFGSACEASERRLGLWLAVGTLPAVVVALLWKDQLETLFSSPLLASAALIVCGLWLLVASTVGEGRKRAEDLTWKDAVVIGVAQAVALVPGISRSGSTIATGLMVGLKRNEAPRFSFLLMIVAVTGATVLEGMHVLKGGFGGLALGPTLLAMAVAGIAGYASISVVMKFIEKGRLAVFGAYCLVAGVIFLLILL